MRHNDDKGAFFSILDDSASVTFNIPLNYHSFVVTIQQTRESDKLEFNAYWKGSDNDQGLHIEFIQLLASISGITIKSYLRKNSDLQVVLKTENAEQVDLVCRMIDHINHMSINKVDYFQALVALLHPRVIISENDEEFEESDEEYEKQEDLTRMRIKDIIWKQFTDTGTVPSFINWDMPKYFNRKYLENNGKFSIVVTRVIEELEGKRPESLYSKRFLEMVLKTMPIDQQKELLYCAASRGMSWFFTTPKVIEMQILTRLYKETPKQVLNYFSTRTQEMPKFKSLLSAMIKEGGPISKEQAKLHKCYAQAEAQGGLKSGETWIWLHSWETLESY